MKHPRIELRLERKDRDRLVAFATRAVDAARGAASDAARAGTSAPEASLLMYDALAPLSLELVHVLSALPLPEWWFPGGLSCSGGTPMDFASEIEELVLICVRDELGLKDEPGRAWTLAGLVAEMPLQLSQLPTSSPPCARKSWPNTVIEWTKDVLRELLAGQQTWDVELDIRPKLVGFIYARKFNYERGFFVLDSSDSAEFWRILFPPGANLSFGPSTQLAANGLGESSAGGIRQGKAPVGAAARSDRMPERGAMGRMLIRGVRAFPGTLRAAVSAHLTRLGGFLLLCESSWTTAVAATDGSIEGTRVRVESPGVFRASGRAHIVQDGARLPDDYDESLEGIVGVLPASMAECVAAVREVNAIPSVLVELGTGNIGRTGGLAGSLSTVHGVWSQAASAHLRYLADEATAPDVAASILLDYCIVLEMLFAERSETSSSTSRRCAAALETGVRERLDCVREVRRVYDMRSRFVHGGRLALHRDDLACARELARRAVRAAYHFYGQALDRLARQHGAPWTEEAPPPLAFGDAVLAFDSNEQAFRQHCDQLAFGARPGDDLIH